MSYNIPENLKYTKEHEWAQAENNIISVGITDFAQSSLGDIVFVEIPEIGKFYKKGEPFGVVESIKSVSDLYAPISGEVVARNDTIEKSPEKINADPYNCWLIKLKVSTNEEYNQLLSSKSYTDLCH